MRKKVNDLREERRSLFVVLHLLSSKKIRCERVRGQLILNSSHTTKQNTKRIFRDFSTQFVASASWPALTLSFNSLPPVLAVELLFAHPFSLLICPRALFRVEFDDDDDFLFFISLFQDFSLAILSFGENSFDFQHFSWILEFSFNFSMLSTLSMSFYSPNKSL